MIKCELHLHAIGGSICADGNSAVTVDKYKKAGYGAIVVTTHYSERFYGSYPGETHKEKIDFFFKVYDDFAKVANAQGIKTFFGTEIRCIPTNTEYTLIGFDRQFIYENPPLFKLSPHELFALANKNGCIMYQTHPFRKGVTAGDPKFMHGAESFNGHYHHPNNNDQALKFCKEHGLIELSGSDYHHDDQPITAAIYIPNNIDDEKALAEFLLKNEFKSVNDFKLYEKSYEKHIERKKKNEH